jgi:voltage-gated potassium channel
MDTAIAPPRAAWRRRLYTVIFGTETRAGRIFDIVLLWLILSSVVTVMLESVASIRAGHGPLLRTLEWVFTVLFTAEYALRIASSPRPVRYVGSFFGLVDLLAVLPTYVSLFVTGTQSLAIVRALRLLRVFRILKLAEYTSEARVLASALRASRRKITVFIAAVVSIVLVVGSLMYLIEGEESGFTSIPVSMYWAIVTMTTVGYGDIAPRSPAGQFLASILMILGYGVIAVPTGIVTVEMTRVSEAARVLRSCPQCALAGHDSDALHCKRCGSPLAAAGVLTA